jgi:hypothetical protein
MLRAKSLTINDVTDVTGFPDLHINLVSLELLNPNLNLETGNLALQYVRITHVCEDFSVERKEREKRPMPAEHAD